MYKPSTILAWHIRVGDFVFFGLGSWMRVKRVALKGLRVHIEAEAENGLSGFAGSYRAHDQVTIRSRRAQ